MPETTVLFFVAIVVIACTRTRRMKTGQTNGFIRPSERRRYADCSLAINIELGELPTNY